MSKTLNGGAIHYLNIILLICMAVSGAEYGGGDGTIDVPYRIYDSGQLNDIGKNPNDWGKNFILMADIDLADLQEDFQIIAPEFNKPFTGTFDGNNYSISNLNIAGVEVSYIGIFGNIDSLSAVVENLTVIDPVIDIDSGYGMGSVIGRLGRGRIYNCTVINTDISGINNVGGLVGQCYGEIELCITSGTVTGRDRVGGIAGSVGESAEIGNCGSSAVISGNRQLGGFAGSNNGMIATCVASGQVSGAIMGGMANVGGFVGTNFGLITSCYATGNVSGFTQVAGFCGINAGTDDFVKTVEDCYSTGRVSSIGHSGAFSSHDAIMPDGQFIQCFWDVETSGRNSDNYAAGLTTQQMQDPEIFIQAGWNFQRAWRICKVFADYPRLFWEQTSCPRYNGGNGSEANPYIISEQQEFIVFTNNQFDWNKHFILMIDIDLEFSVYQEAPLCPDTDKERNGFQGFSFNGTFNGNGHTIRNILIDVSHSNGDYLGLFGKIDTKGKVNNLVVENITINGSEESANIGGLAGKNEGRVVHCKSLNIDAGGFTAIGGLVGSNEGHISKSCAAGVVDGITSLGGLAGRNSGDILECYSDCQVSAMATAGGLVGYSNDGMIFDCYSLGEVFGDNFIGGFIGYCDYAMLERCYSSCAVSGTFSEDGFIGYMYQSQRAGCFWDMETTGVAAGTGATGLTKAEMMHRSVFQINDWDFTGGSDGLQDIWRLCIDDVDYPTLAWEYSEYGDFICPDSVTMEDLALLIDNWLNEETDGILSGDADFDGKVDNSDFAAVAESWID